MEVQYFGYMAAFCTSISFLPQALKVIRTKDTASLSLSMYSIFSFGLLMWLTYGILLQDLPMIIANTITLFFAAIILGLKIRHTLQTRAKTRA
ncbi:SemiSWEET transporter [Alteromonas facilis]|uniref:SemiSWEET transporter n=1 Tax=Alteromonas facilis TaxID=2048004 RepID=UPI000C291716|nr:SemiSWEET transporter [Alteromonas facilis]